MGEDGTTRDGWEPRALYNVVEFMMVDKARASPWRTHPRVAP